MASGNFALWFHTIRRKEEAYPGGEYTNIFAKRLNKEWKDRHSGDRSFVNEHYISIIRKEDTAGVAKIANIINKIRSKADKGTKEKVFKDAMAELDEITERVMNGFSNYGPELLSLRETPDGVYSEILKFLGIIVNCGQIQNYRLSPIPLDH